jgi:hypothetical protein
VLAAGTANKAQMRPTEPHNGFEKLNNDGAVSEDLLASAEPGLILI